MKHVNTEKIIDICRRNGRAFEASTEVTLSGGGSLDTVFVTGDNPVIFYSRRLSFDGEGINAYIYRDPTYTGGTQTIEVNNANDINPESNQSYFLSGVTVTDQGIQTRAPVFVFGNTSNQGQGAVLEVIDEPQIMPPNSEFLFVLENRDSASQDLASIIEWIEPDKIPGLVLDDDGNFVTYTGEELLY